MRPAAKSKSSFRCVIHGSFRKHFDAVKETHRVFTAAGIEVLAPKMADITAYKGGFALLEGEEGEDPRMVELLYLHNLKRLGKGEGGFSYFVNPEGYIGKSASYELGIAQVTNVPCFFLEAPQDHPAYLHKNSVWTPENLATYVMERNTLPEPKIKRNERLIHKLWEELMVPGSVVAAGGIITYENPKSRGSASGRTGRELLFVRTHKWGDRFSIVGGKVRRHERLSDALKREVKEETGLDGGVDAHICTFDQLKNSDYYVGGVQHIFVDYVVKVGSKKVRLNDEAQDYVWMPARQALRDLDLEPNARHTVELYAASLTKA